MSVSVSFPCTEQRQQHSTGNRPGLEMFAEMFNIIMSWPGQFDRPTKGLHRTAAHQINLEDKTLECKFSDARVPLVGGCDRGLGKSGA